MNDIVKQMEVNKFTDSEIDSKINRASMIQDFITTKDFFTPEFEYLNRDSLLKQKGFMDMFKSSFTNRPVESDLNPTPVKKEGWSTQSHSILPSYRMVDESAIKEMELDTLFFIFYYQKVRIRSNNNNETRTRTKSILLQKS